MKKYFSVWLTLRFLLGFTFLWAFLDKTFGLGFSTAKENAWIQGGSPTYYYLTNMTKGPFEGFFQSVAGNSLVEWLFMLGILFIGVTLTFGVMVKLGALAGMLMYTTFYISGFIPPEHNPVVDEHVINFVLMYALYKNVPECPSAHFWRSLSFVQKNPFLK